MLDYVAANQVDVLGALQVAKVKQQENDPPPVAGRTEAAAGEGPRAAVPRAVAGAGAQADLQRQQAALSAERASAGQSIGETRMQDLSLSRKTQEDIATDLRDTQEKLSELLPKLVASREQLERSRLRAPVAGTVVGLNVFTVGGVIEPGQAVMEIVPEGRSLVIQSQVDPADADDVAEGETAQVRFVSVHDRTLPLLHGTIRTM